MLTYVLKRVGQTVLTAFLAVATVFVLLRMAPGDPAANYAPPNPSSEQLEAIRQQFGLDQPIPVQFLYFTKAVFTGDLGNSIGLKLPVMELISRRLPVTLMLTGMAALIALLVAVPLSFVAALNRGGAPDAIIRGTFQIGLSMPVFYVGLVLLTVFAAKLRWFPVGGYGENFLDDLYHLFLPATTLALSLSAVLMRNLRAAIIGVVGADYVDFARAKGLRARVIMARHVLRNALISTVTLFGLSIGTLLGGAVITETVFAIPGAGRLMIEAIYGRDYPVIQGLTIALALLVSFTFLLTDIVQAWLDPRVAR